MPNLVGWTINIDHALIRQKCFDEPHEVKWKPLSRQRNVQVFMKGESLLSDLNYGDDDPEGLNVVLVVPSQEGGVGKLGFGSLNGQIKADQMYSFLVDQNILTIAWGIQDIRLHFKHMEDLARVSGVLQKLGYTIAKANRQPTSHNQYPLQSTVDSRARLDGRHGSVHQSSTSSQGFRRIGSQAPVAYIRRQQAMPFTPSTQTTSSATPEFPSQLRMQRESAQPQPEPWPQQFHRVDGSLPIDSALPIRRPQSASNFIPIDPALSIERARSASSFHEDFPPRRKLPFSSSASQDPMHGIEPNDGQFIVSNPLIMKGNSPDNRTSGQVGAGKGTSRTPTMQQRPWKKFKTTKSGGKDAPFSPDVEKGSASPTKPIPATPATVSHLPSPMVRRPRIVINPHATKAGHNASSTLIGDQIVLDGGLVEQANEKQVKTALVDDINKTRKSASVSPNLCGLLAKDNSSSSETRITSTEANANTCTTAITKTKHVLPLNKDHVDEEIFVARYILLRDVRLVYEESWRRLSERPQSEQYILHAQAAKDLQQSVTDLCQAAINRHGLAAVDIPLDKLVKAISEGR